MSILYSLENNIVMLKEHAKKVFLNKYVGLLNILQVSMFTKGTGQKYLTRYNGQPTLILFTTTYSLFATYLKSVPSVD